MRENLFGQLVSRVLRSQGAMVYPLVAGARGAPSGWPDKLVVSRAWSGLLELKSLSTRVERHQERVLLELATRWSGHVFVVREAYRTLVTVGGPGGETLRPPVELSYLLETLKELSCS
jgi:hypothetical protein